MERKQGAQSSGEGLINSYMLPRVCDYWRCGRLARGRGSVAPADPSAGVLPGETIAGKKGILPAGASRGAAVGQPFPSSPSRGQICVTLAERAAGSVPGRVLFLGDLSGFCRARLAAAGLGEGGLVPGTALGAQPV